MNQAVEPALKITCKYRNHQVLVVLVVDALVQHYSLACDIC